MKLAGRFHFVHSCPSSTYEDIQALMASEKSVELATFRSAIGPEQWREIRDNLGYDHHLPISKDCDFRDSVPIGELVREMAILYALEDSTDLDGVWWSDQWRIPAEFRVGSGNPPARGVIFQSRLDRWTAEEIRWEDAPG